MVARPSCLRPAIFHSFFVWGVGILDLLDILDTIEIFEIQDILET